MSVVGKYCSEEIKYIFLRGYFFFQIFEFLKTINETFLEAQLNFFFCVNEICGSIFGKEKRFLYKFYIFYSKKQQTISTRENSHSNKQKLGY